MLHSVICLFALVPPCVISSSAVVLFLFPCVLKTQMYCAHTVMPCPRPVTPGSFATAAIRQSNHPFTSPVTFIPPPPLRFHFSCCPLMPLQPRHGGAFCF